MFKEEKTAQIASFFVSKEGGRIAHLKLIKLLFIADKFSLRSSGFPMTYDQMKSLPHGPILDNSLNYIDSKDTPMPVSWSGYLIKQCNNTISLQKEPEQELLSEDDLQVLDEVYDTYGSMGKYELRDHTHDRKYFPEWTNPGRSSLLMSYEDVFIGLGDSSELAQAKANEIKAIEAVDSIFDSL